MRFSTCSIALVVSSLLLGLGVGNAEATQRSGRSMRSGRSSRSYGGYARGHTRSYRGYRSYGMTRSYRGTYRGHSRSFGGYRGFYRSPYRYSRPYGYRPYYRSYYRPSYYWGWAGAGWGYGPWPSVGVGVSYTPAVQTYSGGPTNYSYQNGAVRTEVNPKQTEVWLDGYYSGTVDDFDGSFQRLYMPPGEHEILFRLDGYRTHQEVIRLSPGRTYKLHHEMEPLGPGESTAPPPEPPQERAHREPATPAPRQEQRPEPYNPSLSSVPSAPSVPPAPRREPQIHQEPEPRRNTAPSRFGVLSLRVQPPDSQVYINGELWGSLEGFEELAIHLPVGQHRIEIRGRSSESFETEVEIRTGEATPLHVKLEL